MRAADIPSALVKQTAALGAERAALMRRIAFLGRTKKLFELWHILHKPLVYVMLAIAAVHVFVAVYFGYAPGRGR
jgi:cytochrome b561